MHNQCVRQSAMVLIVNVYMLLASLPQVWYSDMHCNYCDVLSHAAQCFSVRTIHIHICINCGSPNIYCVATRASIKS